MAETGERERGQEGGEGVKKRADLPETEHADRQSDLAPTLGSRGHKCGPPPPAWV